MSPVLPTDAARWRRIESILDLALDLSPAERSALLDESCIGDPDLRAEVEAVLAADAQAGSFLATPAGDYAPELLADAIEDEDEPGLSGHQMGPYRLLREIGGGGMGTVYEAEDARLGRRVAVKLLPPEYSRDRRAKERFLREARAAAAVDHPNLCTVHDVGESDGRLYIVLSFYEGETLRERLRRGPLTLAEARDVAIQVARGLARAHEAGIVHRDIKPANVILTRRGEAKILDFGIARLAGDEASLTRTGASWGTPAYMSPEQARGEPVDGRTDIWSLAVMLYEMLAGRRPFRGESLEAVVSAIQTREPEPLERVRPEVPRELAQMVEKALTKDPAGRYGNVVELLADLEAGRAPTHWQWNRKAHRPGALALILAILVFLIVALLWQSHAVEKPPPNTEVPPSDGRPLEIAVLQPVVKSMGTEPEVAFIASDIVSAVHSALLTLEGLQPLDPPEQNEGKGSEAQRLREADEVLLPLLHCREDSCQATLSRRTPGGEVLKASGPFEVQADFENAFQLAEAVRVHVQRVYSDHRRLESNGATVRAQDYSAYVELQHQADSGKRLGEKELEQLSSLLQTSPGLVSAYVLAAGVARNLGNVDGAIDYSTKAEKLALHDPRPLLARFQAELAENRLDAALDTMKRLENLAPGDPRVKIAEADLLEKREKLREALVLREEVAFRRPTWRNVLKLATLEFRMGASDSARRRLEDLLEIQPDNQYVLERLAAMEAFSGDLKRAAKLHEELFHNQPVPPHLITNLGLIYYLLDDYSAAEEAYRQALDLAPGDLMSRFNLATVLEAQGEVAGAQQLYQALVKELTAAMPSLDAQNRMLLALCLARLGQQPAAARLADEVLEQRPDDMQTLRQAAQIYALLGDPIQAFYYADRALKKGLRREWFTIPDFRSLENDPKFQSLLSQPIRR